MRIRVFTDQPKITESDAVMREIERQFGALDSLSIERKQEPPPPGTLPSPDPATVQLIIQLVAAGIQVLRGIIQLIKEARSLKAAELNADPKELPKTVLVVDDDPDLTLEFPTKKSAEAKFFEAYAKKVGG